MTQTAINLPRPRQAQRLTTENSGLETSEVKALVSLGINSVERFTEVLHVGFFEVAQLLNKTSKDLYSLSATLNASLADPIHHDVREKLEKLPCAMGLDLEQAAMLLVNGPAPDSDEVLELRGYDPIQKEMEDGYVIKYASQDIRHQGDRGTCAAHAIARCREQQDAMATEGRPADKDLSEQYLYWQMKEVDGRPNREGSTLAAGGRVLHSLGICVEADFVYQKERYQNDPSQKGPQPTPDLDYKAAIRRIPAYVPINPRDLKAIKRLLANDVAVAYGVQVFKTWKSCIDTRLYGEIFLPVGIAERPVGGHAITLTGYVLDDDIPGGGGFIFDNSWGEEWAPESTAGPGKGWLPFRYAELYSVEAGYLRDQ